MARSLANRRILRDILRFTNGFEILIFLKKKLCFKFLILLEFLDDLNAQRFV